MSSRRKSGKQPHRVHCCCQAYQCYLGQYVDAYGITQSGVEVRPETKKAHTLADEFNQLSFKSNAELAAQDDITTPSASQNPSGAVPHAVHRTTSVTRPDYTSHPASSAPDSSGSHMNFPSPPRSPVEQGSCTNRTCSAIILARENGVKVFESGHLHKFTLSNTNPMLLLVILVAVILTVHGHLSMSTASWLLECLQMMLEFCLTHQLNPLNIPKALTPSDAAILRRIPKTITTAIKWLNIDPVLVEMTCCPNCFALYPLDRTPKQCNQKFTNVPGGPPEDENSEMSASPSHEYIPDLSELTEKTCGHPLLKHVRGKWVPVRKYAVHSFSQWIAHLLSRPDIESWLDESLEESRKPFDASLAISDIHQSKAWKHLRGPDGTQYTATSGNLTFAMFMDAINPYGNKQSGHHTSITFIVMVCLTLPLSVRYNQENIFVVGIAPGPREPSLEQTNWILRPVVTELQTLWNPGLLLSQTHLYKAGRLVRCALLTFIADIPAVRRSLGFPSASAKNFCSICLLTKDGINILDPRVWPIRTCSEHKNWAYEARDAKNAKARQNIFKKHGVRYSVLIELEYWNIIENHVVDPMHNLLLGLIAWHVRRFWSMKDTKNDEDNLPPITKVELLNLLQEHTNPPAPLEDYNDIDDGTAESADKNDDWATGNGSSSSDESYDPLGSVGWNGKWDAPPLDEIIFDSRMLDYINSFLSGRVHIPTWIKRGIPYLGKASFGKLKADEWRNLATIQLPLIIIPVWVGQNPVKTSLLRNFLHLVSLVNIALKRSIKLDQIEKYRNHIKLYLESSLQLFQHCHLAPNHHMAMHEPELLERFGPVRSWWSFPFERLMGSILKGNHNNHIGELEITFLKNYGRASNLASLMTDHKLPHSLRPYITQMQTLFSSENPRPKKLSNSKMQPIRDNILDLLVKRLNNQEGSECKWVTPEEWAAHLEPDNSGIFPVHPQAIFHDQVMHNDVSYSTFAKSQDNCMVVFKSHGRSESFGRIFSIFTHRQASKSSQSTLETWLHIQCFPQISKELYDPFKQIEKDWPDAQFCVRGWGPTQDRLVRLDEIVAHCAWVMYKPGEIKKLNIPVIALLSCDR